MSWTYRYYFSLDAGQPSEIHYAGAMRKEIVIFTDLDETLLDRRGYSFEKALPALELLRKEEIPLVICSSKTRAEVEVYRKRLQNTHPFITENGGGIFLPKGYFEDMGDYAAFDQYGYDVITLGTPYATLREALSRLHSEGFDVRGFGDMSAEEVSGVTGLSNEEAVLSKDRQFDEAFLFSGEAPKLEMAIKEKGLNMTQGRLYHLMGLNDKGKAVDILKELYRLKLGNTLFIALGDSPSDRPMLNSVDFPVLVKRDDGKYDKRVTVPNIIRAGGIGPAGWNRAVLKLIKKLSS